MKNVFLAPSDWIPFYCHKVIFSIPLKGSGGRFNNSNLGGGKWGWRNGFYMPQVKAKAIPIQAWTDPEVSRRMKFPNFKTIGT